MSVVVFGGTGFIGTHLTRRLLLSGEHVVLVTRQLLASRRTLHADLQYALVPEDSIAPDNFAKAIGDATLIYNLAGFSDPSASTTRPLDSLNGNCLLQCHFLDGCRIAGTRPRVVYSSSRLVYGRTNGVPVSEISAVRPINYYAAHKLCSEQYLQIAGDRGDISYTICRLSNPYGQWPDRPEAWRCQINEMIRSACQGHALRVFGDGSQLRDYIHISDVVDALILCGTSNSARNEVFNIGQGKSISFRYAAELIAQAAEVGIAWNPWPREALLNETGDFLMDVNKAQTLLGFEAKCEFELCINELVMRNKILSDSECEHSQ
jgi:UDP-glucose 4-epimerase